MFYRSKKRAIHSNLPLIFLFAICSLFLELFYSHFYLRDYSENRIVSYGEEDLSIPFSVCYGNYFSCAPLEISASKSIDSHALGEDYIEYSAAFGDFSLSLSQTISVVDDLPPVITAANDPVSVCKNGKIPSSQFSSIDNYDGNISGEMQIEKSDKKVRVFSKDSFENYSEKFFSFIENDTTPPVIALNTEENLETLIGNKLNITPPTATDDCDDVSVEISGEVDYDKEGEYTITYSATDSSGNRSEKSIVVSVRAFPYEGGTIYLTFDDGPGPYTSALLDILKKHNVKATFFVTGRGDDADILREYNEGHAIGLHTMSHNYEYIYSSQEAYFADLSEIQSRVRDITGENTYLMRFPGGSSNTISAYYDGGSHLMSYLASEVERRGYTYFDWNLASGDAGEAYTKEEVISNVTSRLIPGGTSVILQHDIKPFSVEAVEDIIIYAKQRGYEFKKLDSSSFTAHHGINN